MQAKKEQAKLYFAEVLAEILQLQDSGKSPSRDEFIGRFPEHHNELSVYFDNMAMVETISDARDLETCTEGVETTLAGPSTEADTYDPAGTDQARNTASKNHYPTFTRYEILRTLGQGAMGAIYLARDRMLDRKVALKVPLLLGNSQRLLNRFFREAKTVASLQHRNICPLFDIGVENGQVFITMAYVQGKPLSNYMKSGKSLSQVAVARTIRKLAIALQEAHENGVVHRDLKPANVMVDSKGEPIVMDFGLARQENLPNADQLTQPGMILGTPAYMSPDQIRDSGGAGPSADVYSLGVMMYQMLTGSLPYTGDIMSVISKILTVKPPPPSAFRTDIDPELEAICLAAMDKNVKTRFTSMQEFAEALTRYLKKSSVHGVSPEKTIGNEGETKVVALDEATFPIDVEESSETEFSISESSYLSNFTSIQDATSDIETNCAQLQTQHKSSILNRTWLSIMALIVIAGVLLLLPNEFGFIRIEVTAPGFDNIVSSTDTEFPELRDGTGSGSSIAD